MSLPTHLPQAPLDPTRPVYLRVGDWNPECPRSRNFATGDIEYGLSVYELMEGMPVIPPDGEWAEDDLRTRLQSDAPKYLVQGEIAGWGGDGEPVLSDVRIVGLWSKSQTSPRSVK